MYKNFVVFVASNGLVREATHSESDWITAYTN